MTIQTDTTIPAPDTRGEPGSHLQQLRGVLTDERFDKSTKLARLQGWRGDDLDAAVNASALARGLGPLTCGVLAIAGAITGSLALVIVTLATAVIGVFADHHPAENVYNAFARRTGRQPMPPNRAARRLGCAVGTLFLGGAAISLAVGATATATVLLVVLGSLALFVGTSGLCVPSIMFTLLFGVDKATNARLFARAS